MFPAVWIKGANVMTVEEILAGESKNVEFKVQRPKDSGKYMKTVVAFSNGEGGKIIFGVDDKTRQVIGIPKEFVFSEIDAITSAISDSCEPLVIPDVYLQTLENKTIIVAEISPGKQRPYYIKSLGIQDGTYIRVSGTSRPAGRDLTAEMYYEDEGRSYDNVIRNDLTVTEKEIQDLCQRMKQVALWNSKSQAQKDAVKDVTKNVLLSWGLLAEGTEGRIHPTNGYIFLVGNDPFLSQIQCGMFKGTTRAIFVDKREYGGALWEQIEEAFQFVLRNIHLGAQLEGVYRQDIYELPPDSIRELIINAVMNCSFLQNSHIQVAIYDDRLEITSPGGLMPGVTLTRMKEGYSKIRNRALAHAFSYMNLIEAWGSGIPKLIQAMHSYGLKEPEFLDLEIGFRVNLYRSNETPDTTQDTTQATQGTTQATQATQATQGTTQADISSGPLLTDADKSILRIILQNPALTQKEMALELGWTVNRVKYYLSKLKKREILRHIGSSQKGHWDILLDPLVWDR